ncbi:MAG: hypothetical protein A2538_04750 [Candidatus Magasanikbacteria bacterium RIFOXYD2_FULL_41_14]|uniref:Glycosyltransferase 2-like domain-containing protein n=1 Tax=Candidatus Magasanikbacteria bacterium RIFOXYD2_FULL_41_14 TaxID=1798709 RepID=A0A1F6PFQ1_9BACT|nr:MAG: hypothetical protein A2538_04750 [Candidatus Magasanikbacteria bacterium RIFOXYD2_FULL_41_14]
MKKISIVIPTYNRLEVLKSCVFSIVNQDFNSADYEIIIVDNGPSNDGTDIFIAEIIKTRKNIFYFQRKEKGCIFARNFGFQEAKGEILLTVDDDVEFLGRDCLTILAHTFEDKDVGMVGSVELHGNKDEVSTVKSCKNINLNKIGRVTKWGSFYASFNQLDGYDDLVVVDHFRSCFMAVRADLFNAVGGFDAKYNADGMGFRYETDLCMRVKNLAKKVVINPKIRIWHKVAKRSRGFERGKGNRYLFLVSRNHMYFMLKFFWHKHRWFWFVYDFLIGAYRTPGLLFLLKRRELSWANLVCVFRGKLSGLSFLK